MNQPPHNPYQPYGGAPPQPGPPPQAGYGQAPGQPQYGPPPQAGYGQPYSGPAPGGPPPTKKLDDQSVIWLCVAAAGFFFGFGFITGPLAWIFGSKLRNQYRLMGLPPNGAATAAMILGIVETALYVLVIGIFVVLFAVLGAAAIAG